MAAAAATALAAERSQAPSLPRVLRWSPSEWERLLARLMSRLRFVPSAPGSGSVSTPAWKLSLLRSQAELWQLHDLGYSGCSGGCAACLMTASAYLEGSPLRLRPWMHQ